MALDANTLETNIKTEANIVTMEIKTIDENGNVITTETFPFKDVPDVGKIMSYKNENLSGFELLIKLISDKVIEHLTTNIKTSLLERMNNLEVDFDTFTQAMAGVGAGPATAVPAGVTAWLALPTNKQAYRTLTQPGELAIENADVPFLYGNKL